MRHEICQRSRTQSANQCRILKEIGKGERIALSKLAVEHLEKTGQPYCIAIDAAIWSFQNQAGQGGTNPALRTLFFRLLKLLALPIHPVFVYDGKNKPLTKRNKTVTAYATCLPNEMSKKLIQAFGFPYHTAPGEAEAECATLQKHGVVDAVMSQDVDTVMFGATSVLRDWSQEGSRANKTATHVSMLNMQQTKSITKLDPDGMILVALLSGGDYDTNGVAGFGPGLACEIAKAGFASELLDLMHKSDVVGLAEWRERLQCELETNESGYFKRKHKTVKIPDDFPDPKLLAYYTKPVVSPTSQLDELEKRWRKTWDSDIDIPALRVYVADTFDWRYISGAKKLIRCLAGPLLAQRLGRGLRNCTITSADSIKGRRSHFISDGMPELRLEVVPFDIVGLSLENEEECPAYLERLAQVDDSGEKSSDTQDGSLSRTGPAEHIDQVSSSKERKSPQWDPWTPEKMWVSESIVKLGVPALVEQWEQMQRDILADPIKFATRKCVQAKKRPVVTRVKALDNFFTSSKPVTAERNPDVRPSGSRTERAISPLGFKGVHHQPTTPRKRCANNRNERSTAKLDQFFSRSPLNQTRLGRGDDGGMQIQLTSDPAFGSTGSHRHHAFRHESWEGLPLTPRRRLPQKHARPATSESDNGDVRWSLLLDRQSASSHRTRLLKPSSPDGIQESEEGSGADSKLAASPDHTIITMSTSPPAETMSIKADDGSAALSKSTFDHTNPHSTTSEFLQSASLLPASVTQRSKSRGRNGQLADKTALQRDRPVARHMPLEQSFSKARSETTSVAVAKSSRTSAKMAVSDVRQCPMTSATIKSHLTNIKTTVCSRDSLPGTWKDLDLDLNRNGVVAFDAAKDMAKRPKRVPRVSLLDLTDA